MIKQLNVKLLENIVSLFTIKGLQYILGFITFPYLVRVLKVENYGLIVYAQSIVQYFILFTDYGFNLFAPREIAQKQEFKDVGKVFSDIFYAKILLCICSTMVFAISVFGLYHYYNIDVYLYLIFYIMVFGNVFFPVWFFHGMQEMRYITLANIIARVLSVLAIFLFVKKPSDYLMAAFCQSIVPVVAAISSWIIIFLKYKGLLNKPDVKGIKYVLKEAYPIFLSSVSVNLYTASNIVFLGMMTNAAVVGYYSGAQKIIDNIRALISPVTQALYPYVSKKAIQSKNDAVLFLHKVVVILGCADFLLGVFLLIFAEFIIEILFGNGFSETVIYLRVMAFIPFVVAFSNIFGGQAMLIFGLQKAYSKILVSAAILNTCIVLPLIYFYQGVGVSISIFITECFVTVVMWYVLRRAGINIL